MLQCEKASLTMRADEMRADEKKSFVLEGEIEMCRNFHKMIEKMIHTQDYLSLMKDGLTITIDCATSESFLKTYSDYKNQRPNNNILIKGIFEIMDSTLNWYVVTFPYLSIEKVSILGNDRVLIRWSITNFNLSKPTIKPQQEKEE